MRLPKCLILILLFAFPYVVLAQDAAAPDSSAEAAIRAAWTEARAYEGTNHDSLWRSLAAEVFAYYRAHPGTPGGRKAAESAFLMWGNTDAVGPVTQAIDHLDDDSELWATALMGVGNAYGRGEQDDEYLALLQDLQHRLAHPRSRTAVLAQLGERALHAGRDAEARPYFEQIIALNADSFRVAAAEGALYEIDHLGTGMRAPEFIASTIDGDTLRLVDYRGRAVLLDFWATWCGPCLPEIPHLIEVQETYGGEDFAVIGVSLDTELDALEAMVEERDLPWPNVWQEGKWNSDVAKLYNVRGIPQTYLLDQEGRIVAKGLRGEAMDEAVGELLRQ